MRKLFTPQRIVVPGCAGTWPKHGGSGRKAWRFSTHCQRIGQTGRKDRQRQGAQGSEM